MRKDTECAEDAFEAGALRAELVICALIFLHNLIADSSGFWFVVMGIAALAAYLIHWCEKVKYETLPYLGTRIQYRRITNSGIEAVIEQGYFKDLAWKSLRATLWAWCMCTGSIVVLVILAPTLGIVW